MAQDQGNGSYVVEYLPEAAGAYSVSVRLALTAEAVAGYGRGGTGAPGLPELRAYSSRGQEAPVANGGGLIAAYFANAFLSGEQRTVRIDAMVDLVVDLAPADPRRCAHTHRGCALCLFPCRRWGAAWIALPQGGAFGRTGGDVSVRWTGLLKAPDVGKANSIVQPGSSWQREEQSRRCSRACVCGR